MSGAQAEVDGQDNRFLRHNAQIRSGDFRKGPAGLGAQGVWPVGWAGGACQWWGVLGVSERQQQCLGVLGGCTASCSLRKSAGSRSR